MKLRKPMKLSEKTISILKNFSQINQSIFVKTGNKLRTMSVMKNILAEAVVEEDFPKDFAIYDLNQFLNGLALYQNPDLDFTSDSYLFIREGKGKAKYSFADPEVIVAPPEKEISLPSKDVCFQINSNDMAKMIKASSIYQVDDLAAVGKDGVINLVVRDKKNDNSNEYSIEVGTTDRDFVCNFKVENIKILPGSYDVVISSQLLSKFTCSQFNLCYYIALEPDSTFE